MAFLLCKYSVKHFYLLKGTYLFVYFGHFILLWVFFLLLLDLHLNRLLLAMKKPYGGESEGVYFVFIEKLFLCLVGSYY